MKKFIFSIVFIIVAVPVFSQSNKFAKNDFGMRYGISFGNGGTVSSDLNFSGMVTDNIEVGSGIGIGYNNNSNEREAPITINTLEGVRKEGSTNAFITAGIRPFVAYHFPIKSNLDVYLGANVGFNISSQIRDESFYEVSAPNYSYKYVRKQKQPVGYGVSGGLSVGCRYFFYKGIAVGVEAGLGAGGTFTKGKATREETFSNSGSLNPNNGYSSTNEEKYNVNNKSVNLTTIGNVGITLSFYLSPKKKNETAN